MRQEGHHNGRVFYKQRHTEGDGAEYLFFVGTKWCVSKTPGKNACALRNRQDTQLPPTTGWEYYDGNKWNDDDTTLVLEFSSLNPCRLVRVDGDAEVKRLHSSSLGDYVLQIGRWSAGRPVYQLINSQVERYLLVVEGYTGWYIKSSTSATTAGAFIRSGKATNSPSSPLAGSSLRFGVTKWSYYASGWKEGYISTVIYHC